MKYSVIRDQRSEGDFTPTGQTNPIHFDNRILHVLYTDVDGKPSVDRLKIKTGLLQSLGVTESLAGKDVEIEYGQRSRIVGLKVIGYRQQK